MASAQSYGDKAASPMILSQDFLSWRMQMAYPLPKWASKAEHHAKKGLVLSLKILWHMLGTWHPFFISYFFLLEWKCLSYVMSQH
jgi:hypothetical protein